MCALVRSSHGCASSGAATREGEIDSLLCLCSEMDSRAEPVRERVEVVPCSRFISVFVVSVGGCRSLTLSELAR